MTSSDTNAQASKAADDFVSIADAAKQLFVSRPYVLKLLERGELDLHHEVGNERFITQASVQRCRADRDAAAQAYQDLATDES
ncbi:MerR family transcriptional regulator [Paraburkholderia acidisoli]|uniref:Helix-turn-helix domain-containing protein n=1 Tax=Paraburkholderia acidisoli TaxID=2571748 RepID=A0A7Z2GIE7_9BURK|nr:hypothetical protein [Paraburkholderia acidisoli]QGZ62388.1 hypothetical protein FAZ98_11990 [Paraburkholderia acidisoli]